MYRESADAWQRKAVWVPCPHCRERVNAYSLRACDTCGVEVCSECREDEETPGVWNLLVEPGDEWCYCHRCSDTTAVLGTRGAPFGTIVKPK